MKKILFLICVLVQPIKAFNGAHEPEYRVTRAVLGQSLIPVIQRVLALERQAVLREGRIAQLERRVNRVPDFFSRIDNRQNRLESLLDGFIQQSIGVQVDLDRALEWLRQTIADTQQDVARLEQVLYPCMRVRRDALEMERRMLEGQVALLTEMIRQGYQELP